MPRAIGAFRAAGWPEPAAWPVHYVQARRPLWEGGLPDVADHLVLADTAAREWLALLVYFARGWTDALVPGPHAAEPPQ
jgi:hypothetical protein